MLRARTCKLELLPLHLGQNPMFADVLRMKLAKGLMGAP